jgi:hypothetical protein
MIPEEVSAIRSQLWDAGFRPVPIRNYDDEALEFRDRGKKPLGVAWGNLARRNPPDCLDKTVAFALNTGILCDGLRPFDLDIDDCDLGGKCRAHILTRLGNEALLRYRRNSGRCLLLYRATTGTPHKVSIVGKLGKIEVLGHGNQFVAQGMHNSGVSLEWFPDAPWLISRDSLPAVTEQQVLDVLTELAPLLEAPPPKRRNGYDQEPGANPQAEGLRIAAALHAIPNNGPADWEGWNRVGMAVWAATNGSSLGFEAFNHWSARNSSYDPKATRERWAHYIGSRPTQIGAGTIFHMAAEALRHHEEPPDDRWPKQPVPAGGEGQVSTRTVQDRLDRAEGIWRCSGTVLGSPAASYLNTRCIGHLQDCSDLRYRADCPHPSGTKERPVRVPALVAAVRDVEGRFAGIYRIFLQSDGSGRAEVEPQEASLGFVRGGAVRLASLEQVLAAGAMVIAVGIETATSAGLLLGLPAWAGMSSSNFGRRLVLPTSIRKVMVAADRDAAGIYEAEQAVARLKREGREVGLAVPHEGVGGFNDLLIAGQEKPA